MTGTALIVAFVAAIVLMIVAISRWKVHPFLSIMGVSLILALLAGVPDIPGVIGSGFAGIFASIGLVIIFGALIGSVMEETGAAMKLSDMVVRLVGKKHPSLAMQLMGWIVSIPVFCDSGFVILNPIRKALVSRTGVSSVQMTFALSSGLYIAHVFIPPTPGPIVTANALGVGENLLMVMGFGALCSVFPMIAGLAYAKYIGKKVKSDDEASSSAEEDYRKLLSSFGKLPSGVAAISPILVPILLMAASSIVKISSSQGWWVDVVTFFGTPVIALATGFCLASVSLFKCGKGKEFYQVTEKTLKTVGPILFITAAGGVLGKVIAASDMLSFITSHSDVFRSVGIFFPFILAAILKTALGSSTVSMTTTSGIIAPLLTPLGFSSPGMACLACMAIGAGAMTVSHANDSYFWIVTNFGAMSPDRGYKVQTAGTLVLGLASMLEIFLLSVLFF